MPIGAAAAAAALASPLVAFVVGMPVSFVHELGHAIAGWFFGYPSLPTVNFFSGGMTLQHSRIVELQFLAGGLLLWYAFAYRRRRAILLPVTAALVLYPALVLTPVHQALVLAAGHGFELLVAGLLLVRAMEGERRVMTRALYAAAGFFIVFDNARFSFLLAFDRLEKQRYQAGGGLGFQMDFSRLAAEYLHVDVTVVAAAFFGLCLLTLLLSLLVIPACRRHRHAGGETGAV